MKEKKAAEVRVVGRSQPALVSTPIIRHPSLPARRIGHSLCPNCVSPMQSDGIEVACVYCGYSYNLFQ